MLHLAPRRILRRPNLEQRHAQSGLAGIRRWAAVIVVKNL